MTDKSRQTAKILEEVVNGGYRLEIWKDLSQPNPMFKYLLDGHEPEHRSIQKNCYHGLEDLAESVWREVLWRGRSDRVNGLIAVLKTVQRNFKTCVGCNGSLPCDTVDCCAGAALKDTITKKKS